MATDREYYEQLKAAGLCPACKGEPQPGRVYCRPCLERINGSAAARPESRKEAWRRYARARQRGLKAQGLCVTCGVRPQNRTLRCEGCERDYNRRYGGKNRKGNGKYTCSVCRRPGHNVITCPTRGTDVPTIDEFAGARREWE